MWVAFKVWIPNPQCLGISRSVTSIEFLDLRSLQFGSRGRGHVKSRTIHEPPHEVTIYFWLDLSPEQR